MDRDNEARTVALRQDVASNCGNRHAFAQQAASRGRPECNYDQRLDNGFLDIDPPPASVDFVDIWPLMQPSLATLLKFKVFDRVGDKDSVTIDAGITERPIKHATGGADER